MLALSGLQHYAYCKRQWALIHLEGIWAESWHTAQGGILHARVHEEGNEATSEGTVIIRGLALRSLRLGLYGVADVVEYHRTDRGVPIKGRSGLWLPYPVEYKRGRTKEQDWDRVQLCAQALCLEEVAGCAIEEGSLFYGETRRRERVPLGNRLRKKTEQLCQEIHVLYEERSTPLPQYGSRCKGCSLLSVCNPKALRRSARQYWQNNLYGEE